MGWSGRGGLATGHTANALAAIIRRFAKELSSSRLVLHIGYDLDTLRTFTDDSLDWVYLDTTHQYEQTLKELQVLRSKVKPAGSFRGTTGDRSLPPASRRVQGGS